MTIFESVAVIEFIVKPFQSLNFFGLSFQNFTLVIYLSQLLLLELFELLFGKLLHLFDSFWVTVHLAQVSLELAEVLLLLLIFVSIWIRRLRVLHKFGIELLAKFFVLFLLSRID